MAKYTRTQGANARAQSWEDLEEGQRDGRTGSWLPLDTLDEGLYVGTPQLRAMPQAARRSPFPPARPRQEPPQATAIHPAHVPRPQNPSRDVQAAAGVPARAVAMVASAALCALAVYASVSAAVEWAQVKLDDFQYGRPRTTQLDAFVGHGESEGVPTHFIALNLNRRVTLIELPGGDSARATTIVGPYLFGEGEDLTPVQATVQDLNGDSRPDLIVSIKNEQLIYLNDGGAFKLMTPEERSALQKSLATPAAPAGQATEAVDEDGK
jgi:hypothetical protein